MQEERFTVDVPGGQLAGRIRGGGPPLLLLHGGPGLAEGYLDPLLVELDGYRVAGYQQRGLPPSTARQPYDVPTQVADAVAVLDALGWSRPLALGHSWGGHLLLHLMAARPDRLAGALVVDAMGGVGDGGLAAMGAELQRRTPAGAWARSVEIDERAEAGLASQEELVEGIALIWPGYFADPRAASRLAPPGEFSDEVFEATMASARAELPRLAERLGACRVPSRFVHGAASPIPVQASQETAALMGAPVDLVPDAGHFPWLEAPGAVRRSLDLLSGATAEHRPPLPAGETAGETG